MKKSEFTMSPIMAIHQGWSGNSPVDSEKRWCFKAEFSRRVIPPNNGGVLK